MKRQILSERDHVIICGFGRFGRVVAADLQRSGTEIVVIEANRAVEPELQEARLPYILGSADEDEVLEKAGIQRAKAIVLSAFSESDNVFISLAAREELDVATSHVARPHDMTGRFSVRDAKEARLVE